MSIAHWAGAFIMGLFLYIGAGWMMANIITGASVGEVIIRNVVPVLFGLVPIVVVINVFRG